jgi:hypothetical protein
MWIMAKDSKFYSNTTRNCLLIDFQSPCPNYVWNFELEKNNSRRSLSFLVFRWDLKIELLKIKSLVVWLLRRFISNFGFTTKDRILIRPRHSLGQKITKMDAKLVLFERSGLFGRSFLNVMTFSYIYILARARYGPPADFRAISSFFCSTFILFSVCYISLQFYTL